MQMNVQSGDEEARYRAMWREIIKARAVKACGDKCCICNGKFPNEIYHFHHFNPLEKEAQIFNRNINSARTWNILRDELRKTVLLCPTCHSLVHCGYLDNPSETSFNMEYYTWDLAENKRNSRNILPIMVEEIRKGRPEESGIIQLTYNLENITQPFCKGNIKT